MRPALNAFRRTLSPFLCRAQHAGALGFFVCCTAAIATSAIADAETVPYLCDASPVPRPADFPDQPINILIPRGAMSGALPLSQQIAQAIAGLTDPQGEPLGIEVNLLFKSDGNLSAALEFFHSLPPNGYNIIQLNDNYASFLAETGGDSAPLVPLSLSQITPSQIYIRSDDARYSSLAEFVAYARTSGAPTQIIANFGEAGGPPGLEDFLIGHFIAANDLTAKVDPGVEGEAAAPLSIVGFESGPERYFSLFRPEDDPARSDLLIEQPGDIARLLEGGLLKPIFTLLPERYVTAKFRDRLGDTAAFDNGAVTQCGPFFRYRGFFVPHGLPEERRRYLAWLFTRAFDAAGFQDFNRALYMDVLYDDPEVIARYCSAEAADQLFETSLQLYRDCIPARGAGVRQ
ncbi:hypothetical protein ACJ5NV_15310 [Loktanella agnita]